MTSHLRVIAFGVLLVALACLALHHYLHAPHVATVVPIKAPLASRTPAPSPEKHARPRGEPVPEARLSPAQIEPATPAIPRDLAGEVLDHSGIAVVDAELTIFDRSDEVLARCKSDSHGTFAIPNLADRAAVVVTRHMSFLTDTTNAPLFVDGHPAERMTIRLAPGAAIDGDVRLPSGTAPSTPVRVCAMPLNGPPLTLQRATVARLDRKSVV